MKMKMCKMNEVITTIYLAGDIFMPEMCLRHSGFLISAFRSLTKNKERIQNLKETRYLRYINHSETSKACFQHDMVYGVYKDLPRRTASDRNKVIKHLKLLVIQSMSDIKKATTHTRTGIVTDNQQLATLLTKPMTK